MKNIFSNGPSYARRMLLLSFIAGILLLVDATTQWLKPIRLWATELTIPIFSIALFPRWASEVIVEFGGTANFKEKSKLQEVELLILKGHLQRMAWLTAENVRLRNLLNATELLQHSVLVAELIGASPDPLSHTIIINRGKNYKVFEGQTVLDADGLMGQVIEVYGASSKVLLISDSSHALPVQILRNGMLSIAEGHGDFRHLSLRYVASIADIKAGDQLVSSGLGGRYPAGYPVGVVVSVNAVSGNPYLAVDIEPSAKIDQSRYLLLVSQTVETFGANRDAR
jgi:rod shape-determining protein MreC|tara:strand:- start:10148 stop:10996 length:849 start_codon:yes stop_codon:yes gene_type:complete